MKATIILMFMFLISNTIFSQNNGDDQISKRDNPFTVEYTKSFEIANNSFQQEMDTSFLNKSQLKLLKQSASLLQRNEIDLALKILNNIKIDDSQGYNIHYLRGILEMKINDMDNAYNSLMKSIDFSSNDAFKKYMYMVVAGLDQRKGYIFNSLSNLKKSYEIDSTYIPVLMMLGKTYETLGRTDEAILYIKKTLHIDNTNISLLMILGMMYNKLGRTDEAVLCFKKALQVNPNLAIVWGGLGSVYQENDKHHDAIEAFNKILENKTDPSLKNTYKSLIYSQLSYSKLQLGLKDEALNDVNRSIDLNPQNSLAYRNRALIYVANKTFEKACDDINTALKLGFSDEFKNDNIEGILSLKAKYCRE